MEENNTKEHYICKGGCQGVSETPGTCGAGDCASYQDELEKCDCADEAHNNFE